MSRLRVEPERSEELVAAFRDRAGLVESHDGFIDRQIWRSDRDLTEVSMVSRWRHRNAFTAYLKSGDHRVSHNRMAPQSAQRGRRSTANVGTDRHGGPTLDLFPLATEICRRYRQEFPDEQGRYGDAGNQRCVHDNQHLLNWGVEAANGHLDVNYEVSWLASVLEARGFPIDRLVGNLELGAAVVLEQVSGPAGVGLSRVLADTAVLVRSHGRLLDFTV